ncbi:MAG: MarR family transcriptional regulator [Rhizobiales bacterium]|nr:MarR family transcriptional regulator [Hyphomicrobiales bacterium]
MSTKLTKISPAAGYDLVDSHALALTQATEKFRERILAWLLLRLREDGFDGIKASQLSFLGSLDCGVNFAAELARGLGISRQAVHKTVRELEGEGWLATRPHEELGNKRVIVFTQEGERMMSCARTHFLTLDTLLEQKFGDERLAEFHDFLDFDPLAF